MFPRSFFPAGYFPTFVFPDGFFQSVETRARTHRRRQIIRKLRRLRWLAWEEEATAEPLVRKEREAAPKLKR
jgi:hypothetical protein